MFENLSLENLSWLWYLVGIVVFIGSAVLFAIFLYLIFYWVRYKSIYMPEERKIQIIMRFGKFHAAIMSIGGHRLNDPRSHRRKFYDTNHEAWDIIPADENYKPSWQEKWNIYFFPWPFFKKYTYSFSYTKLKKKGDVKPDDIIIWSDEKTGESIVARSGTSDYVDFQVEYPTISGNIFTSEMAKVVVFTNNTLQVINPYKMLFRIENWLGVTSETITGALRGVVGKISIQELNQVRTEDADTQKSDFTRKMMYINLGEDNIKDGIEEKWGVRLTKSIFKAFTPGDADAEALMDSFLKPKIATQVGDAAIIEATKTGEANVVTATANATAYEKEQEAILRWKKKNLVEAGLAEVDENGNITKLLPEANVRVGAEALKEFSKLTGTFVTGSDLGTMLNINQTKGEK